MNHIAPMHESAIRDIPLCRLALAPENVRKTPPDESAEAQLRCAWDSPDEWDAVRAHSGLPGTAPHPTLHSTLEDAKASARSIGVAWRSNRPSLGSSTACPKPIDDRPRTPGCTLGSSSAAFNDANAGMTTCGSSSGSSRSSDRIDAGGARRAHVTGAGPVRAVSPGAAGAGGTFDLDYGAGLRGRLNRRRLARAAGALGCRPQCRSRPHAGCTRLRAPRLPDQAPRPVCVRP